MDFKPHPAVAIVILNWNGRQFLEQFLPAVIAYSPGCAVVVADNASTDDSVNYLKSHLPEVKILELPENYGFCEGYNIALKQVSADYYVLLNSDVAVTPGWTNPIIKLLEKDPKIAACQPKIKSFHQPHMFEYAGAGGGFIDYLGYPFCRGRVFNTLEEDLGQYNDTRPVFWATGACLFIRAHVYHEVEGLEPAFFAHMEEIDICWRLWRKGYKIMYCGESEVYHVGGGTLHKSNPHKTYLNFRNGLAMVYKNMPPHKIYKLLFLRIFLDWVAAAKFLLEGDILDAKAVFRAHQHVWQSRHYWQTKQKESLDLNQNILKVVYSRSLVWQYFIRRKKNYQELAFN